MTTAKSQLGLPSHSTHYRPFPRYLWPNTSQIWGLVWGVGL